MDDEEARKKRAAYATWAALGILVAFLLIGAVFVCEISEVQLEILWSPLSAGDKYFWFAHYETSKVLIAFGAVVLGLLGFSFAWRAGQRPE